MLLFIKILVALAIVIGVLVVAFRRMKRLDARRQTTKLNAAIERDRQRFEKFLEAAEAKNGDITWDDLLIPKLELRYRVAFEDSEEFKECYENLLYIHHVNGARRELREDLDAYRATSSIADKIMTLQPIVIYGRRWIETCRDTSEFEREMDFSLDALIKEHSDLVHARFLDLVARAPYERQAYLDLIPFIHEGDYSNSRPIKLSHPAEWNSWTARYFRTPNLRDFIGLRSPKDYAYGELRLQAAEALDQDDFVQAQYLLACSISPAYRADIGEIFIADLTRLVARHFEAFEVSAPDILATET